VYFRIAVDSTNNGVLMRLIEKDAAYKALESYINCLKTGDEKLYKDCIKATVAVSAEVYNQAITAIETKDKDSVKIMEGYSYAIRNFELIMVVYTYDKKEDMKKAGLSESTILKNAGLVAYYKKDYPKVKKYMGKLADISFIDADVYIVLSKASQEQGDTATAIKYIEQGRDLKSDNQDLIDEELFLFSRTNQGDKLITKLTKAIDGDPSNAKYYYYRASTYEGLFKNDEKRTDYQDNAEADYKKSLELDPADADVNISLGIFYFNKSVPVINERENTDNVKQKKKFDDLDKKAKDLLNQALKYYETANTLKPDDLEILDYLKRTYAQLGNEAKVAEISSKIKSLNK
jgi:tetratricopeptide (TPR) repeat protein